MTVQYVQLTYSPGADFNYLVVPQTSDDIGVLPTLIGSESAGTGMSVAVVSSDSYAAGKLLYSITIVTAGLDRIDFAGGSINYSDGASQDIYDVLVRNGWSAPPDAQVPSNG